MVTTNIIAVRGQIGSGKDTFARIVLMLLANNKIKPEFSLSEAMSERSTREIESYSGWQIKKFAAKLKQIASILTGIPVEKFEDQEFKKTALSDVWNYNISSDQPDVSMTVREFLQRLGTEGLRNGLHKNVWLNSMWADYKPNDNWIITDMRFKNEFDSVKLRNGVTVEIIRPGYTGDSHPSERELDGEKFDYTIVNDGDLNSLVEKTRMFLKSLNLL